MLLQVCFARNVHGRTLDDIAAMAAAWEPVPPLFQQLDASGLLFGRDNVDTGVSAGGSSAGAAGGVAGEGGADRQESASVVPPIPANGPPRPGTEGHGAGSMAAAELWRDNEEDAVSPPAVKAASRCVALLLNAALSPHRIISPIHVTCPVLPKCCSDPVRSYLHSSRGGFGDVG